MCKVTESGETSHESNRNVVDQTSLSGAMGKFPG